MITPLKAPGIDPMQSHLTRPRWTVPRRRWTKEPTGFMMALATRSEDTAVSGGTPKKRTSTGVISAPPPMPVRPTTMPMPNAAKARRGSKVIRLPGVVEAGSYPGPGSIARTGGDEALPTPSLPGTRRLRTFQAPNGGKPDSRRVGAHDGSDRGGKARRQKGAQARRALGGGAGGHGPPRAPLRRPGVSGQAICRRGDLPPGRLPPDAPAQAR